MPSKKDRLSRYMWLAQLDLFPSGEGLAAEMRNGYDQRLDALKQYREGAKLLSIEEATGIGRQHLYYLCDRMGETAGDGRPLGHRALIPNQQKQREYPVSLLDQCKPAPGALQALFKEYPSLFKTMVDLVVHGLLPGSQRPMQRNVVTPAVWYRVFCDEVDKLGRKAPQFPYTGGSNGKPALRKWVHRMRQENDQMQRRAVDKRMADDPWFTPQSLPSGCFERVECDGHSLNVNWMLEAPSLRGEGVIRTKVSRLWLIALVEIKSTAILGYSVAFGTNYGAGDVARAVRCALVPWKPRDLSVTTIAYKPGEGLPNGVVPELAYVCWDELWVDGASATLADLYLSSLERTVNCVMVVGPVGEPNVRAHVEGTFHLLEAAVFLLMEGTTGSYPNDERKAKTMDGRHIVDYALLRDCIDLVICRWNTGIAPGTSVSRIDVLRYAALRQTTVLRRVPVDQREQCDKYDLFDTATIGMDKNKPVLRWRDARYFGPGLHLRADLVGKDVLVCTRSEDVRCLEVWLVEDGMPLGNLNVERRWSGVAHSLTTRRQALEETSENSFIQHAADIPIAFRQHLEAKVRSGKSAVNKLARAAIEQGAVVTEASEALSPAISKTPCIAARPAPVIPIRQQVRLDRSFTELSAEEFEKASQLGSSY